MKDELKRNRMVAWDYIYKEGKSRAIRLFFKNRRDFTLKISDGKDDERGSKDRVLHFNEFSDVAREWLYQISKDNL